MIKRCVYSEVFEFINLLDDEYCEKIPYNIVKIIIDERDKNYIPKFTSIDEFFKDDSTSGEAKLLVVYLYLKYWYKTLENFDNLKNKIIHNEKQFLLNVNKYFKKHISKDSITSIYNERNLKKDDKSIDILKKENKFIMFLDRIRRHLFE